MECPLHMTEPSGQYAVVQVCIGTVLPSAVLRVIASFGWTLPLGQGTPQLTPWAVSGGWPSSQLSATGPTGCARAEPAGNASAIRAHSGAIRAAADERTDFGK